MLVVFSQLLSILVFQSLSLNLALFSLDRLAGHSTMEITQSPCTWPLLLGLQECANTHGFFYASEGLNSDLLACAEGSFLTEPFPHPTKWHLIQTFILLWKIVKSRLSQCFVLSVMVLLLFACFLRSEVWSKTVPKLGDMILRLCPAEPQRRSFFFLPLIKSRKYLKACCPEPLNTARANNKVKSNSILLFSSSCQRQKDNKLSRFWGQMHTIVF